MKGGNAGTNTTTTTTTTITSGGKKIVVKGNGGVPMDINNMMAMFKDEMDGDIQFRMGELNEICQNSTKQAVKKAPEVKVIATG